MSDSTPLPVVIVGAGLAGLACGQKLRQAGLPVLVLEKSRSYGGRCSTRRFAGAIVDHGAQYFTMRDPLFQAAVEEACGEDVLELTSLICQANGTPWQGRGDARYYHRLGQNRLAKALARDLDVRQEHTVNSAAWQEDGSWLVGVAESEPISCQAVVWTCPGPQTSRILCGDDSLAAAFQPCLTGLFCFAGNPQGRTWERYGLLGDPAGVVAWSACENHKQGRVPGDHTVLVGQAGPEFSHQWLEADAARWLAEMEAALRDFWDLPRECVERFGHRWRFARNTAPLVPSTLPPGVYLAGDTCTESRVESAWLSGHATALQVLADLG